MSEDAVEIRPAIYDDIDAVLPMMVAYCEFYEVEAPNEPALREMSRQLIDEEDDRGYLLVAADPEKGAIGFSACGWKWSTLRGARCVVMEDLFVDPKFRGRGIADRLVKESAAVARSHGAPVMLWETQPTNKRAQAVYDRVGGKPETLIEYELELGGDA